MILSTVAALFDWRDSQRRFKATVAVANGCFDGLHPGHIYTLRAAYNAADSLCVLINDDDSVARLKGANRPFFSAKQRAEMLDWLAFMDVVHVFSGDSPASILQMLKPEVLVKGADSVPPIPGAEFCGKLLLAPIVSPAGLSMHSSDIYRK